MKGTLIKRVLSKTGEIQHFITTCVRFGYKICVLYFSFLSYLELFIYLKETVNTFVLLTNCKRVLSRVYL